MEQLTGLFDFARSHPAAVAGAVIGLVVLRYVLNRKSRLQREADEQLQTLRREGKGKYDELRPLQ